MTVEWGRVMKQAMCGDLDWLCCLETGERVINTRDVSRAWTMAEAQEVVDLVCKCIAMRCGGAGATANGKNMTLLQCATNIGAAAKDSSTTLDLLSASLAAATLIPNMPEAGQTAITTLLAIVEAVRTARDNPDKVRQSDIDELCDDWKDVDRTASQIPGIASIWSSFYSSNIGTAITACCVSQDKPAGTAIVPVQGGRLPASTEQAMSQAEAAAGDTSVASVATAATQGAMYGAVFGPTGAAIGAGAGAAYELLTGIF